MKTNSKPTLEEMEAAYRRHSLRIDSIAGTMPIVPGSVLRRRSVVESLWRPAVAAAAAIVVLLLLPSPDGTSASPKADIAACRTVVANILQA